MEMHEKQKKLQEKERLMIEQKKQETEKNSRVFHAKKAPNFKDLQEKFIKILDKKKSSACPTIPKPFTFHEPKKKPDLCYNKRKPTVTERSSYVQKNCCGSISCHNINKSCFLFNDGKNSHRSGA